MSNNIRQEKNTAIQNEGDRIVKITGHLAGEIHLQDFARMIAVNVLDILNAKKNSESKPESINDTLLTKKQSTAVAFRSISSLDRLRKNGTLPYTKIGKTIFFKYQDLLAIRKEVRLRGFT